MPSVFVDTSAWFALADRSDTYHSRAAVLLRSFMRENAALVTTNHVVGESYTLMRAKLGAREAQRFLDRVNASAVVDRVFVSQSWEDAAEDLLRQYEDQDLSYVDATSFITMRRLTLGEAFSFDRHFLIMGFTLSDDLR